MEIWIQFWIHYIYIYMHKNKETIYISRINMNVIISITYIYTCGLILNILYVYTELI